VSTGFYNFAPSGTTNPMPEGVAAALSMARAYGTDPEFGSGGTRPRASDRGRVYLAPLCGNASACFDTDPTTKRTRLSSSFANVLLVALKKLAADALSAAIPYVLATWSKKTATAGAVTQAWVDDRPDYQRRRTDQSTLRYAETIP